MKVGVRRKKHRNVPVLKAAHVKVGFPAGGTDGDVLDIAIWNHFGTPNADYPIPERPFLSNAIRNNQATYKNNMRKGAKKIIDGENTAKGIMTLLGIKAQGDIQEEITALQDPPNTEATIRQKGSSNPLIDTGTMRGSVTYEVEE